MIFISVGIAVNCNKYKGTFWKWMKQTFKRFCCSYLSDFRIMNQRVSSFLGSQPVWWRNINTDGRKTLRFQLGLSASCLLNKPPWKQSRRGTDLAEGRRRDRTREVPLHWILFQAPWAWAPLSVPSVLGLDSHIPQLIQISHLRMWEA